MRVTRRTSTGRTPCSSIIGGPIAILIGLAMGWFGWNQRADTVEFLADSVSTTGTVVELIYEEDSEGDETYYPVIEFSTQSGESLRHKSRGGSYPAPYDIGEGVEILYNPANPHEAQINSFTELWLFSYILLGIGALFVLFGVLGFVRALTLALGVGGLLGLGAYLFMRDKKKDEDPSSTN